jgi:hypothetical protein
MSRRTAFVFLILLAAGLFARPLLKNEVFTFRDHSDYFQPLRYFTAVELRNFRLPLWNPYNASGEPWLANPQTAVFYPPFWIYLIVPFAQAYVLFLLFHLALLGCGAFLLFSRFAGSKAAFLGAMALMLCGPTLSMLDIQNNLTTFAWIPLIVWCALSEVPAMWSGAAIAMAFLAGEPFFATVGAVMFVFLILSRGDGEGSPTQNHRGSFASASLRLRTCANAAITAFGLSAIVLLPFVAMIAGSDRAGATPADEILRDSMTLGDWTHIVWTGGSMHQQFVPIIYMGVAPVLLAIAGIVIGWRSRGALSAIVLLLLSVVVAAGRYFAPAGALLVHLPLTILRYPARVVPLGALAIVVLAVIGFDRAIPARWRTIAFPVAAILILLDVVPHVAMLLQSAPFDVHGVPYSRNVGRDGKIVRFMQPQRAFDRRIWISGYLNLLERRFDAWTAAPVVSQTYVEAYESALRRRDALDGMSIAYVLEAAPTGVVARHNTGAFPLAFFRDDAGRMFRPAVLAFTTSAVLIGLDAPSDGTIVVTQQNASGWSVEVDHQPATQQSGNLFRAVRITRGHHEVIWGYHPRAFTIGSVLTMLMIVRMLLSKKNVKRLRHKKSFDRDAEFA